jgi:hypothetical protein
MNFIVALSQSVVRGKTLSWFLINGHAAQASAVAINIGEDRHVVGKACKQLVKDRVLRNLPDNGIPVYELNPECPILTELRIIARTEVKL